MIKKGIHGLYYYVLAHIKRIKTYDKKYLKGKHFSGRMNGLCSIGWKWIVWNKKGCKKMHVNQNVKWPCSPRITVINPQNIEFDPDDLNNFQGFGNYYQAIGRIIIGKGTYIAPNVGLITSNHTIGDIDNHDDPKNIILGKKCWIGMNSMILPGVVLGDNTVVGAGSVVTKSFEEGNCVIAGNPAKIINIIEKNS